MKVHLTSPFPGQTITLHKMGGGFELNGLDLFSGIGGLTLALRPWVKPIAYCENDRYAQSVLLSRMASGELPLAPIWDDVRSFGLNECAGMPIQILYGGFPCQDISVAGHGKGLAGRRSGLFFEIVRLTQEINPDFVFLENVPAIRTRGLRDVVRAFTDIRYDCRWTCVSAAEVGAPHLRKRWFFLAHANGNGGRPEPFQKETRRDEAYLLRDKVSNADSIGLRDWRERSAQRETKADCLARYYGSQEPLADADSIREPSKQDSGQIASNRISDCGKNVADPQGVGGGQGTPGDSEHETKQTLGPSWWAVEPDVGRVAHGVPNRVDRVKSLGNSVVPAQAREAFKRLMGDI